jgi:hypothetical protein
VLLTARVPFGCDCHRPGRFVVAIVSTLMPRAESGRKSMREFRNAVTGRVPGVPFPAVLRATLFANATIEHSWITPRQGSFGRRQACLESRTRRATCD